MTPAKDNSSEVHTDSEAPMVSPDTTPANSGANSGDISLRDFQKLIHTMYFEKDAERGVSGTFMWLMEEIGELASALRSNNDRDNLEEEFADVIAWLTTIANVAGIDLAQALSKKYGTGCPGCQKLACDCPIDEKP